MLRYIDNKYAKELIKLMLEVHTNLTWLEQEALRVAIDALSYPQAEDCISRKAALDLADMIGERPSYDRPYGDYEEAVRVEDIESLPTVRPIQKKGKWIYKDCLSSHWTDVYECSECGNICRITTYNRDSKLTDYCSKCGAEMESE